MRRIVWVALAVASVAGMSVARADDPQEIILKLKPSDVATLESLLSKCPAALEQTLPTLSAIEKQRQEQQKPPDKPVEEKK